MGEETTKGQEIGQKIIAIIVAIAVIAFSVYGAWDFTVNGFNWTLGAIFLSAAAIVVPISAILWILGTIFFFMELAGYTFTFPKFKIKKQRIKWDSIDVAIAGLVAAVYGGGLAATGGLVIIPGATWIRPANALTPVFGVLFGIPGALGTAIGNFIADSLAGFLGLGSLGGFVGNFILAYIPYKFMTDHSLKTGKSWTEFYIWGVLINSIWCSAYISFTLYILLQLGLLGMPFEVIWGWFFPWVIVNNSIVTAFVSGILIYILMPVVKQWGLYWEDRIEFIE
ncbi:MAG: QueT transporter family protein [Candidatus Asgardarchaeia archaeon]